MSDQAAFHDGLTQRHYLAQCGKIVTHLGRVATAMKTEGGLSNSDVTILKHYLRCIANSFHALGYKYLIRNRGGASGGSLDMDVRNSGLPLQRELLVMANDAQQANRHLVGMPSAEKLKEDMIRTILSEFAVPVKLQFAMSQRLYYEALTRDDLFWARNDPEAVWRGDLSRSRRRYKLHWAVYDSQINLPMIYVMDMEDTGRVALLRDERRWPEVQHHLMAQALAGLKLVTIARGVDQDFGDLHPKRLRRIHLGPVYSRAFTRQTGPLAQLLAEAKPPADQDWAVAWTVEDLRSNQVRAERTGWFGTAEREVFALDALADHGADIGATDIDRAIILPQRPYQTLVEKNPPGFAGIRKFVVGPGGRVWSYR
ncbi:MAG: hypothetical protein AAF982_10290 [Pseudomonadota bacterium]